MANQEKEAHSETGEFYFKPRWFEKSNNWELYKKIWVEKARIIIMATVGRIHRLLRQDEKSGNYFIGKKISADALKNFEFMTRYNESVHTFMLFIMIWTFNKNFWILDSVLHIINLYCILVQRYNRTRIYSVLEKRYSK